MHNLLTDPLLRIRPIDGAIEALSLPEVYEALAEDRVGAFPALRPHQRHAWHAFLAQLGAVACYRAGRDKAPRPSGEWRALLRGLTLEFSGDEPWRLIVEDPARPAFMQCPAPKERGQAWAWSRRRSFHRPAARGGVGGIGGCNRGLGLTFAGVPSQPELPRKREFSKRARISPDPGETDLRPNRRRMRHLLPSPAERLELEFGERRPRCPFSSL